MNTIDWSLIRAGCPYCSRDLQYHSLTVWCIGCTFAYNWEDWHSKKGRILSSAGRSTDWLIER